MKEELEAGNFWTKSGDHNDLSARRSNRAAHDFSSSSPLSSNILKSAVESDFC